MVVSINPNYNCNFTCSFCYLSTSQRKNLLTNTISNIQKHLTEINNTNKIEHIDLYGGEISLLNDKYMIELIDICSNFTQSISIVTNGYLIKDWMKNSQVNLSISFDGSTREHFEKVFNNMFMLERTYNVIGLVSENFDIQEFIKLTNILSNNCLSVELKPYSVSKYNVNVNLHNTFNENVIKLIKKSNKPVINEERLKLSLCGLYDATSNKHIYITPSNKLATLNFKNGVEYFYEYKNINDVKKNYVEYISDDCKNCEYFGKCITEHYTDIDTPENCSGHYNLMKKYEREYFPLYMQVSYKYLKQTKIYDDISNDIGFKIKKINNIINEFKNYIETNNEVLIYPLKSFVVSVIFATLISRDFNTPVTEVLELDIFHNTDKFFKKYSEEKEKYDLILHNFKYFLDLIKYNKSKLIKYSKSTHKIINYYNKEYNGINN